MATEAARLYVSLDARTTGLERGLARAQAQLKATERVADTASARVAQSFERRGKQMQRTGKSISKWVTLPIVAGLALAGKKAADFEAQLSSLESVTGANARQMARFKKQAMQAGAATKFSALDAAKAQTELAKGGLSVQQIMRGGLKSALALAAAGELDLATAAATTVRAMKLFKIEGGNSMQVADALATAANKTTADVDDFAMALTQGGGAAKSAGLSFNETITALEALAEVGVKNSDAGTSLKTALLQLIGPTKKQRDASREAGVSFLDQHGKMKSLVDISKMLRAQTDGMTKAERTRLFQTLAGNDGFRTLLALYDAGPAKLQAFSRANEKSGSAAAVAAKKQDNLKGKIEEMMGSLETTAIAVGGALIPALSGLAQTATPAINDLAQAFSSLPPEAQQAILAFAGLAAAIGPALFVFGSITRVAGPVIGVLGRMGGAVRDVGLAFRAGGFAFAASTAAGMVSPLGLAAGAAAVLAGAIYILSQRESEEERIARASTEAKRSQAAAVRDLTAAEREAAGAVVDSKRADIELARARQRRDELAAAGQKGTLEYRDAQLAVREASLRAADAHRREGRALHDQNVQREKSRQSAERRLSLAKRELALANQEVVGQFGSPGSEPGPGLDKALRRQAQAQRALNREQENYARVTRRVAVSDANRVRESRGLGAILDRNRDGVVALISQFGRVPRRVQTRLLTDDQDTVAKLGTASAKLRRLDGQEAVTKILARSKNAEDALRRIKAAIAAVPREVTTTFKGRIDGSLGRARQLTAGAATRSVRNARQAFPDEDVFGAAQTVEATQAERDALQQRFDTVDASRRRRALTRRTDTDRLRGKKGDDRKRVQEDIRDAKRELREFNREQARARQFEAIDLRVTGAEKVQRAKEAIASIRDQLKQAAEEAAQRERAKREKAIDDALKAELSGIDDSAEARELKALQDAQRSDAQAREDADQLRARDEARKKLERAQRSGSQRLISEAQTELDDAESDIADTARERRIEQLEAGLDAKRDEAEGRADIAREGLDAEMAAYQDNLDKQLQALTDNLGKQANAYAVFVQQVQAILGPLGGTFDGSAQQQAEVDGGVQAPAAPRPPRRRRRRPRRRASGGFVHEDFTMVGETGRELVSLPHGSRVHTAAQTERMLAGSPGGTGGPTIVQQFYGVDRETAERIAAMAANRVLHQLG